MPDDKRTYRYAYDPKDFDPMLRVEANERLAALQFDNLNQRLDRIEAAMTRLEKRLWLTVYGVIAAVLAQAVQSLLTVTPT